MVDRTRPEGRWIVEKQNIARLSAGWHVHHTASVGTSAFLTERPITEFKLEAGMVIKGWRDLHTVEGALRSAARREGRFVRVTYDRPYQSFRCVLAAADCPFMIRFEHFAEHGSDDPYFRCTNIVHRHTCVSDASDPTERLKWRLDFFINPSEADKVLGWCPVRARKDEAALAPLAAGSLDAAGDLVATNSSPGRQTVISDKLGTYARKEREAALETQAAEAEVEAAKTRLAAAEEQLREKQQRLQRWRRKPARAKTKLKERL